MLYPFMTLNDGTEIVYSSPIQNGNQEQVKVQIETPVENGFKSATCILPGYLWTNNGYSEIEMASLKELIKSTAHLLIRFSREGGSRVTVRLCDFLLEQRGCTAGTCPCSCCEGCAECQRDKNLDDRSGWLYHRQ